MDDGCNRVQAHAAAAVINFCEHCERKTLNAYLADLLGKLMVLLQRNVRRVSEQAVTAIASIADVAETDFQPYYASFMPGLKQILTVQDKEYRMLRGKAMECISLIGVAVGKETFGADAKEVMDLIIASQHGEQMENDDPQVSYMLQACGRICKCLGEHFQPYLPYVVPPLLKSAQMDPEVNVTDVGDDDDDGEEEEGIEAVTVAVRGQGNKRITIRTSVLEEKETACTMLRQYACDLKEGFFPYVQQVTQVLAPLIGFQYMDDIRIAAAQAMPDILHASIKAREANATDDAFLSNLKDYMYAPLLKQIRAEPDTDTLALLIDCWTEFLGHGEASPPSRLNEQQITETVDACAELLKESVDRRAERAKEQEDEEDEDEEDSDAEREEILVQNIVEALGAMIKVYKSPLLPLFYQKLGAIFMGMLSPAAISTDKVAALCIFDDVIEHCSADGGSASYVPTLLPALKQHAGDEAVEVRQAAVYGLGVWAEHDQSAACTLAEQQQVATLLLAVVERPDAFAVENGTASDNAVSALGKLCRRSAEVAAPCLPRWFATLPLLNDREEAASVHRMLVELVEQSNTSLLGASMERLPDVIIIFGKLLNSEFVDEELNPRMIALLKQVHQGLPHVLQGLPTHPKFNQLTDEEKGHLERALSS